MDFSNQCMIIIGLKWEMSSKDTCYEQQIWIRGEYSSFSQIKCSKNVGIEAVNLKSFDTPNMNSPRTLEGLNLQWLKSPFLWDALREILGVAH